MLKTQAEYLEAAAKVKAADEFFSAHCETGKGGWRSLDTKKFPGYRDCNTERSVVEVYEFQHNNKGGGAKGYFCYWQDGNKEHPRPILTTWMGDKIADVIFWSGTPYRSGFGNSKRMSFRAKGIDGHEYSGTYYVSSGNYCRMKRIKEAQ